jgi:hypothetical protein
MLAWRSHSPAPLLLRCALENETAVGTALAKKARAAKSRTIGIRVTEPEYVALQREVYQHNQTVSEWGRIKVLGTSAAYDHNGLSRHIFTELVGLQLLLMNTLPALLRGDHMPAEQVVSINKQVQATKRRKAQELLAKRAEEPDRPW